MTKDIRPNTRRQYLVSLRPFLQMDADALSVADLNEVLLAMPNQNTRRKVIIALKACVDHPAVRVLRVPEAVPRNYDLPDETTIRLALMTCPHETRLLLAMYAGLRLGELAAITKDDLASNWLSVNKQIDETTRRTVPVKAGADRVPIPTWLVGRVEGLTEPGSPKAIRKALAYAGKRLGIHLNPAQLRTWYCNKLISQGLAPHQVQKLMRHSNVKTTFTHYAKAQANDLERLVQDLGNF